MPCWSKKNAPRRIPSILAATAPADVLRDDLYDRTPARQWARGPVVLDVTGAARTHAGVHTGHRGYRPGRGP